MVDEYDQEQRAAICHTQWREKMSGNKAFTIIGCASGYEVQRKEHEGRSHLVVPVTFLVEGVHCNNKGCFYFSPEVIANSIRDWNGVPLPITHPEDEDGNFVSCNSAEVQDEYCVGRMFNVCMDGVKAKGEFWIDEERLLTKMAHSMSRSQRASRSRYLAHFSRSWSATHRACGTTNNI
jgi:hypothetical protein